MSGLLCADISRLRMNLIFKLSLLAAAVTGVICPILGHRYMVITDYALTADSYSLEVWFFKFINIIAFTVSVFCSTYVSADYADGTLRNKIIGGHSRVSLYISILITNAIAACVIYSVYLLADVCVGIPLMGYFSLFERGRLITLIVCSYLLMLSWTAVLTMIAMLISSRIISLILCICAVLAVLCFGLYQLNVMTDAVFLYAYSESRQNVTLFLADFLPGSQMMELFAMSDHLGNLLPRVMACGSVLWGIVSTTAGLFLFSKKDLK